MGPHRGDTAAASILKTTPSVSKVCLPNGPRDPLLIHNEWTINLRVYGMG